MMRVDVFWVRDSVLKRTSASLKLLVRTNFPLNRYFSETLKLSCVVR
jgi:hypothetical protein